MSTSTAAELLQLYAQGQRDFRVWYLEGADLSNASICAANLRGADLSGANLYQSDFTGDVLVGTILLGANLGRQFHRSPP